MAFMASTPAAGLSESQRAALDALAADLRAVFGARLQSLVAYGFGSPAPAEATCARSVSSSA